MVFWFTIHRSFFSYLHLILIIYFYTYFFAAFCANSSYNSVFFLIFTVHLIICFYLLSFLSCIIYIFEIINQIAFTFELFTFLIKLFTFITLLLVTLSTYIQVTPFNYKSIFSPFNNKTFYCSQLLSKVNEIRRLDH